MKRLHNSLYNGSPQADCVYTRTRNRSEPILDHLARWYRFAWNGSVKNGSAFVYTRHQNRSGTVLWPSVNALLDYVPRPQACTGPTRHLIEAWRLFA